MAGRFAVVVEGDAAVDRDAFKAGVDRVDLAGAAAGLAGALYAFSKGSISPDSMGVGKSVDGLVMVLLGGVQTLTGPVVGAVSFTWLQDTVARSTDYWRAVLGAAMLLLVLVFPQGIAGSVQALWLRVRSTRTANGRGVS